MYLADDTVPTKPQTADEAMFARDARRTRNVMIAFGVVVAALFYFGHKIDPVFGRNVRDVTGRKRDGTF